MKKIFTLALAFVALQAAAQNRGDITVGVRGGLSLPNLSSGTDNPLSEGYSSRKAGDIGVYGEYRFSKLFSLQVGLEYSGQGGYKEGVQALPSGPVFAGAAAALPDAAAAMKPLVLAMPQAGNLKYVYANITSTAKFDYLMVPIQAKFGWNLGERSPFRAYVGAGPFVSFLLKAQRVTEGTSPLYANEQKQTMTAWGTPVVAGMTAQLPEPQKTAVQNGLMGVLAGMDTSTPKDNTQNIYKDLYHANVGIIGHVGVSYSFGATMQHALHVEGGGNYGFVKIQKDDANGSNNTGAATVTLGYSYRF